MRAVLSDIHGNLEALRAVLEDAQRQRSDSPAPSAGGEAGGPEPLGGLDQRPAGAAAQIEPGRSLPARETVRAEIEGVESQLAGVAVGANEAPLAVHAAVGRDRGLLQGVVGKQLHGRPSSRPQTPPGGPRRPFST
jgi:hypothetical protein